MNVKKLLSVAIATLGVLAITVIDFPVAELEKWCICHDVGVVSRQRLRFQ